MSRPFEQVLRDLGRGDTLGDLTDSLTELVAAVVQYEKSGELSFKVKLKPNGEGMVMATVEIKTTVPRPTRGATLFYATTEGSLDRRDPRQQEMRLAEVVPDNAG